MRDVIIPTTTHKAPLTLRPIGPRLSVELCPHLLAATIARWIKTKAAATDEVLICQDEEDSITIAQANEPLMERMAGSSMNEHARYREETVLSSRDRADVSPVIATAMIPWIKKANDEASALQNAGALDRNRWLEYKAACDSGVMVLAKRVGTKLKC